MPLALLADVALQLALAHIDRLSCDRILCAGDVVGYGDDEQVVALLQERQVVCVRGRLAVRDAKLGWCGPIAQGRPAARHPTGSALALQGLRRHASIGAQLASHELACRGQ